MSVWDDMARDAGYRGDEARQMAAQIEEDERRKQEEYEDWQYGEWDAENDCTHCGGSGECDANANPSWDCDDQPHRCHACGGSGNRRDQRIW